LDPYNDPAKYNLRLSAVFEESLEICFDGDKIVKIKLNGFGNAQSASRPISLFMLKVVT
jgi:hypothetical protein